MRKIEVKGSGKFGNSKRDQNNIKSENLPGPTTYNIRPQSAAPQFSFSRSKRINHQKNSIYLINKRPIEYLKCIYLKEEQEKLKQFPNRFLESTEKSKFNKNSSFLFSGQQSNKIITSNFIRYQKPSTKICTDTSIKPISITNEFPGV